MSSSFWRVILVMVMSAQMVKPVRQTGTQLPRLQHRTATDSLLDVTLVKNEKAKILPGDAPLILDENSPTMPKVFQNAGYKTAVIGKWHLELGNGKVDGGKTITPNLAQGVFDYSCIIAATVDRDGYQEQTAELCGNHNPNGSYRGGKYSLFEGGTLVPFFIYWKDQIFPNKNDALISPLDIYASLGKMIGVAVPKNLNSE